MKVLVGVGRDGLGGSGGPTACEGQSTTASRRSGYRVLEVGCHPRKLSLLVRWAVGRGYCGFASNVLPWSFFYKSFLYTPYGYMCMAVYPYVSFGVSPDLKNLKTASRIPRGCRREAFPQCVSGCVQSGRFVG
jgi:hypothetical protein